MGAKENLIKLIQENPTLPLLFMVRNDELLDGYGSTVHESFWCDIQTVYYWGEVEQEVTDDYIDIKEKVQDLLCEDEQYENLTDEEFASYIRCTNELAGEIHKYEEKEEACSDIPCESCLERWLKVKHKEKPKLSDAERVILENRDKNFDYICRDKDGELNIYYSEPVKKVDYWHDGIKSNEFTCFNHLFQFIKWSDEQAYNIEELLKGDENNEKV